MDSSEKKFVATEMYEYLLKLLQAGTIHKAICFVGAKGVGKTTLLSQLYMTFCRENEKKPHLYDLSRETNVDDLALFMKDLERASGECTDNPNWLFIDNIHMAARYPKLHSLINVFVKQSQWNFQTARLVCASSRHGLIDLKLESHIKLNARDFQIFVVNPEEKVARKLIERSEVNLSRFQEHEIDELLQYIGCVPSMVKEFIELNLWNVNITLEKFKSLACSSLWDVMESDFREIGPLDIERKISYGNSIALCCLNGRSESDLGKSCIVKDWLTWTLLKQENCSDIDSLVTAVSPLARDVIGYHICVNEAVVELLLRQLKLYKLEGEGVVRGHIFENFVYWELISGKPTRSLKLVGTSGIKEEIPIGANLLETKHMGNKHLPDEFTVENNACYITKNMEGVDIILSLEQKVYFIQCTVDLTFKYTKKSFFKSARSGWKCVLLTPYSADKVLTTLSKSNAQLSREFKNEKFYISDCSNLLSAGKIESVQGNDF